MLFRSAPNEAAQRLASERACKPGSVRAKRVTAIYLRRALPRVCVPPADMPDRHRACLGGPRRTAVRGERAARLRIRCCSAPVSSYLAFPSLPDGVGRSISVALSRESPPADVIRYPVLWSPDFPHAGAFRRPARGSPTRSSQLYIDDEFLSSKAEFTQSCCLFPDCEL